MSTPELFGDGSSEVKSDLPMSPFEKIMAKSAEQAEWDLQRAAEIAQYEREYQMKKYERKEYLDSVGATPISKELYALWLHTYLRDGGDVGYVSNNPMPQLGDGSTVILNGSIGAGGEGLTVTSGDDLDVYDEGILWLATKESNVRLPALYGSASISLMFLSDSDDPFMNANRYVDGRFDAGHSTLYGLHRNTEHPYEYRATMNDSSGPRAYPDVIELMAEVEKLGADSYLAKHRK